MTIHDIKLANRQAGQHYFEPGTMRFFRSRVGSQVYGDRYFITSEQRDDNSPRLYTVREAIDGGRSIKTVGGFQAYSTHAQARAVIEDLLKNPASLSASPGGRQKRWVYGTADERWHLVSPKDRDYTYGISQQEFKRIGSTRAKQKYLQPAILGASLGSRHTSPVPALGLIGLALLVGWGMRR